MFTKSRSNPVRLNRKRIPALNYQQQEERRLLAGDVTVFDGDNLFIRGDTADNQVEIVGDLDAQTITITGKNGTTINQSSDPLVISTATSTTFATETETAVTVPSLTDGLRINLGAGSDTLVVSGVSFQNDSIVFAGDGDDNFGFYQTAFGGDLFVQTFTGNDNVSIEATSVASDLYVITLDGEDTAALDDSAIGGNAYVVTGNGNDRIGVRASSANDSLYILPIDGDDFVSIADLTKVEVYAGGGADEISVALSADTVPGELIVSGQAGQDSIEFEIDSSISDQNPLKTFSIESTGITSSASDIYDDLIVSGARLGTITELARLTPALSTLSGALVATGLDAALDGPGPLTAFAPLDSAFEKLPDGLLAGLSTEALADILSFHVTSGRLFAGDVVASDSIDTLLGSPFSVEIVDGNVLLNGNVTLAATDILAKNGVVHLLNEVLVPPASSA